MIVKTTFQPFRVAISIALCIVVTSFAVTAESAHAAPSPGTTGTLSLEVDDCPDDAFPGEPGYQVAVELWMREPTGLVQGFQAFLQFNGEIKRLAIAMGRLSIG